MLLLEPTTVSMQAVRRAAQSVSVKPKQHAQAIQIWSAQLVYYPNTLLGRLAQAAPPMEIFLWP